MNSFPTDWPLRIDKSFWKDWAFVRWQALRRNPRYQEQTKRLYKECPGLFQASEINRFFMDYTPSPPRHSYTKWRSWAIKQKGKIKLAPQLEIELRERRLAGSFTSKPIDCWPVPQDVCFPHPYFLDKLRPLPLAIPVEPINRKEKIPRYTVLAETGLRRPKYLRLDMTIPRDELRREIVAYLKGLKALQIPETEKAGAQLRSNSPKSHETGAETRHVTTRR